jgi:hypothetical protein
MNLQQNLKRHDELSAQETERWIRLPHPGASCPFSGLKRTTLTELCVSSSKNDFEPPVRSKLLKKKRAKRGIRLISLGSLMAFINSLPSNVGDA